MNDRLGSTFFESTRFPILVLCLNRLPVLDKVWQFINCPSYELYNCSLVHLNFCPEFHLPYKSTCTRNQFPILVFKQPAKMKCEYDASFGHSESAYPMMKITVFGECQLIPLDGGIQLLVCFSDGINNAARNGLHLGRPGPDE